MPIPNFVAVLIVTAITFTASFVVVYEVIQPFQAPGMQYPIDGVSPNNGNVVTAQVWRLTNDMGQTATVTVQPFTYSGTFTETSSSAGWWICDGQGNPVCKLQLGGNIFHEGGGDRWVFVNYGGQGGGYQVLGTSEGVANGNFPYATKVSGTCQGTVKSPMGSVSGQDTWTGQKIP
jgi:hypothetical protein